MVVCAAASLQQQSHQLPGTSQVSSTDQRAHAPGYAGLLAMHFCFVVCLRAVSRPACLRTATLLYFTKEMRWVHFIRLSLLPPSSPQPPLLLSQCRPHPSPTATPNPLYPFPPPLCTILSSSVRCKRTQVHECNTHQRNTHQCNAHERNTHVCNTPCSNPPHLGPFRRGLRRQCECARACPPEILSCNIFIPQCFCETSSFLQCPCVTFQLQEDVVLPLKQRLSCAAVSGSLRQFYRNTTKLQSRHLPVYLCHILHMYKRLLLRFIVDNVLLLAAVVYCSPCS